MSYYDSQTFINEMSEHEIFHNGGNSQELCGNISVIEKQLRRNSSWLDFNDILKGTISGYFKEFGTEVFYPPVPQSSQELYNLPDISDVQCEEEIIEYLSIIKNRSVENNLKRLFLLSQNEENERFNYFAAIFYALSGTSSRKKDKVSFICLYTQMILTQNISRSMLCFLIAKYAKFVTNSLDASLGSALNSGKINFEGFINRAQFLRIVYALRLVDNENKNEVTMRSRKLIRDCLSMDDYNPRSFIEMIYYFSVFHGLASEENKKIMQSAMGFIIKKIFIDISYEAIEEYVEKEPENHVIDFLEFDKSSIDNISDFIIKEYGDGSIDIKEIVHEFLEKLGVFKDPTTYRAESTYEFFLDNVIPAIQNCVDPQQFCEWMAGQSRFYESYYYNESYSRTTFFGDGEYEENSVVGKAANMIIYENVLNINGVVSFTTLNTQGWKKDVLAQETDQEQLEKVKEYIGLRLDQIQAYRDPEDNRGSEKIYRIKWFLACDRNELYKVILNELIQNERHRNSNRSDILFNAFRMCAESGEGVEEFIDIIDNDEMDSLRFAWFDPSRFEDALLYLCLESNDPLEMFEKITSIPGFEYK